MAEMVDYLDVLDRMNLTIRTRSVLAEVGVELARARAKHGDQLDLPIESGLVSTPLFAIANSGWGGGLGLAFAGRLADAAKQACERHATTGIVSWTDITLEEVFEAFAEDPYTEEFEAECLQAAAMFVAMVQASRKVRLA